MLYKKITENYVPKLIILAHIMMVISLSLVMPFRFVIAINWAVSLFTGGPIFAMLKGEVDWDYLKMIEMVPGIAIAQIITFLLIIAGVAFDIPGMYCDVGG